MNEDIFENVDGEEVLEETMEQQPSDEISQDAEIEINEEMNETFSEDVSKPQKKKVKVGLIVGIVVGVLIVALVAFGIYKYNDKGSKLSVQMHKMFGQNHYNAMGYYNESGRTIQDIADEQGITVEEFLVAYSLPADMPADTEEAAAYYNIPVLKLAEMSNMTFDQFITILGLEDEGIKATDPWGEVEDKVTLGAYIGEEELDAFKEEYKLGDDVNKDTRFGEIRKQVDKVRKEEKEAKEEEQKKADAEKEEVVMPTEVPTEQMPVPEEPEAIPAE
ncbi:MAG: hypothetical protein Q4B31_01750 [Clostridia bacterium]|nr:hypothetical protein [Clostridia bacterium]